MKKSIKEYIKEQVVFVLFLFFMFINLLLVLPMKWSSKLKKRNK